jgi:hypothetical protein
VQEEYRELLRRQRDIDRAYQALLDRQAESEEGNSLLPPHLRHPDRVIYINRRCALERSDDGTLHLVALPGQRSVGLKELRDFTADAEALIIVDPYVFSGPADRATEIADEFKRTARVGGKWLKRIHFVYDASTKCTTKTVKTAISKVLKDASIKVTSRASSVMHDRVWIADRKRALVVGTSFNGLGSRAAFLLPLPDPDLQALLEFLDENSLSRAEA